MVETVVRNAMRCMFVTLILFSSAIAAEKPRLLVLTDIGGDPDDQQSLIRLLVHANEFEIEGLTASAAGTPGELKKETVMPELIREIGPYAGDENATRITVERELARLILDSQAIELKARFTASPDGIGLLLDELALKTLPRTWSPGTLLMRL